MTTEEITITEEINLINEVKESGCKGLRCNHPFDESQVKRSKRTNEVLVYYCPNCGTRHTKNSVTHIIPDPDKKLKKELEWVMN